MLQICSKDNRALHHFCNLECALMFVQQVKQKQWEQAVTKNRQISLSAQSSTASQDSLIDE